MELIVIIAIGLAVYAAIAAPIKRSRHRANCPKCGTECKASPWGTSRYFEARYKCPKCGHKFYATYHYCPVKFHQSESWRSSSGF